MGPANALNFNMKLPERRDTQALVVQSPQLEFVMETPGE